MTNDIETDSSKDEIKYGELELTGFQIIEGKHPKFARVYDPIPTEDLSRFNEKLYNYMTTEWGFKPPKMIISMNGGAKRMVPLNNDQKLDFKRGLIDVAKAAPTWIITGGFQEGISKLVGIAAKDYSNISLNNIFTIVGIGTWGAIYHRHLMEDHTQKRVIYTNVDSHSIKKGESLLDPYHDAFLLYDNGTIKRFGQEIIFRTQFEKYVSKTAQCSIVQVIVEGGKNTILTAIMALNAGTPVVVMKGSRRAADIICDVLESSDNIYNDVIKKKLAKFKEIWGITTDEIESFTTHLKKFREYYQKGMVHLYCMKDFKNNFDSAIIEGAFSGCINEQKLTDAEKLSIAITFDRADVAEERIFEIKKDIDFIQYIIPSLKKNQWKFVDLFVKEGVTVKSFLTKDVLRDLYFDEEWNSNVNPYGNFFIYNKTGENKSLKKIGKIIYNLTDGLFPHLYKEPRLPDTNDSSKYSNTELILKQKKYNNENDYTNHPPRNNNMEIIFTEQDLFLWSLLTQKIEMSRIFWKNGKDHMGSALVGCVVLNGMKKIAQYNGQSDIVNNLDEWKDEFENLAINILSEAYNRNENRAHLLLVRALPYWGRKSCLEIASRYHLINFISQTACQTRLNNVWYGNISSYSKYCRHTIKKLTLSNSDNKNSPTNKIIQKDSSKISKNRVEDKKSFIEMSSLKPKLSDQNKIPKEDIFSEFCHKQKSTSRQWNIFKAFLKILQTPNIKFTMNTLSYIAFLCIFTYVMLKELNDNDMKPIFKYFKFEQLIYLYYLSFVIGELWQFYMYGQNVSFRTKFNKWNSSWWNWFDLLIYIVFLFGIILRFTLTNNDFIYCRTIFAISLGLFFIRLMEFFYISIWLGPKVIMIKKMIIDVFCFLAIYVVSLLAYGTFSLSLLYSHPSFNNTQLKNIIYLPYWQLYGQIDLNYIEGNYCETNICGTPSVTVLIGNAIFLLFSNVLLLSLLIAMFGVTFAKVEEISHKIWAFTRYCMIEEFYYRPILPPPFNVFEIIFLFLKGLKYNGNQAIQYYINDFKWNLKYVSDLQCTGFEQQCVETYLINLPLLSDSIMENEKLSMITTKKGDNQSVRESTETNLLALLNSMNKEINKLTSTVYEIRQFQKIQAEAKMGKQYDNVLSDIKVTQ